MYALYGRYIQITKYALHNKQGMVIYMYMYRVCI